MTKCTYCKKEHKNNNTGCNNSGDWNSGDWNSGDRNSGDRNSGYKNSGYKNSGDRNSGDRNSGDRNSGYKNSGYRNSGSWNSGGWNSGSWNTGYFNTGEPNKIQVFNEWIEMTNEEFEDKYNIYADLPLNRWVTISEMTEDEKKEIKVAEQMGGYLKTLDFKEACQVWWKENPSRHNDFLELPNFSADIFKEITGIDVEKKEEMIEIDGKQFSTSTIKEALRQYVD